MRGITFRVDAQGVPVSLLEVLLLLGEAHVAESTWQVREADTAGEPVAAARLQRASDQAVPVPGTELLADARAGAQLIDGELLTPAGHAEPWVLVRAVRSTAWDVESNDSALLERLTTIVPAAQPLPQ